MRRSCLLGAALAAPLCGCMIGPDYHKPAAPVADHFSEATPADYSTAGTWSVAHPDDAALRGAWWKIYGDPRLDGLEDALTASNLDLRVAEARWRQARATVGYQSAAEYPTITVGASAASVQESAHAPYVTEPKPPALGQYELPFDMSYEVDLWGKVARTVRAAKEEAQASAGDLAAASLSLHAELALDYIELRSADAQAHLLDQTVKAYADALRLTQNRLAGGYAPASDVAQAQTQLDTTRVQATDIGVARAQYEHAIAVLIGVPPSSFHLQPAPLDLLPPDVPPGVPSELLQRRPDIAAAERRVAAANEQIGIALAAYYPSVTLGGQAGFSGTTMANWFTWPSLFWAVGTSMSETVFDGGARRAQTEYARAGYDASVASYRKTVLSAFQQVEDNLAALRILQGEAEEQREAVAAANNSLHIFTNRYIGGVDTYLQVITAQTAALMNERNDVDIQRRRMEASLLLVKALGGGWTPGELTAPRIATRGAAPG